MTAVTSNADDWRRVPSLSDIPICRTLDVVVIVLEAWPLGRVSKTETGNSKRERKYSRRSFPDMRSPTVLNTSCEK